MLNPETSDDNPLTVSRLVSIDGIYEATHPGQLEMSRKLQGKQAVAEIGITSVLNPTFIE